MNKRLRNIETKLLSDNWYTLNKVSFDYQNDQGVWQQQSREVYDRGNGATILLYHGSKVILTRQFRMPTYVNGNSDGMLIETCAGVLDGDDPQTCVIKETQEETGYQISKVEKVFEAYMSPGAVTEIIHFFVGEYDPAMKTSSGGGKEDEQENIEVLEIEFKDALKMIKNGEIRDGKTIMLLQYAQCSGLLR
jgi:GDP-mannose pyrophosphatase NudK